MTRLSKKMVFLVFGLCLWVTGVFTSPSAYALATATSEATIDWSSLTITLDSGMGLTWGDIGAWSEAAAYYNSVLMDNHASGSSDWGDTSATAAFATANGHALGMASTTASQLRAYTENSSDLGGRFNSSAHGWGEDRWGYFTVSGSGDVLFSVPYSLSTTLNETLPRPWELTTSFTEAGLHLENRTTPNSTEMSDYIWYPDWNLPLNGTLSQSGTLSVSLSFNNGDSGYMRAGVGSSSSASSVPEPGTLLLLGSGLLGAAAWVRRRTGR